MIKARLTIDYKINWGSFVICILPSFSWLVWYFTKINPLIYPTFDSASYLSPAIAAFNSFKNGNWIQFIIDIYIKRDGRGTAVHIPAILGLLMTNGDLQQALALANCGMFILLSFYLYLLISLYSSGLSRTVIFWTLSTSPSILIPARFYMSELPLLTSAVMTVYYAIRSDWFRRRSYLFSAAISLGACACFRPIETCVIFGPAFIYLLFKLKKERSISIQELLLIFIQPILPLFFVLFIISNNSTLPKAFCVAVSVVSILIVLAIAILNSKKTRQTDLVPAFSLTLAIAIFWNIPHIGKPFLAWLTTSRNWAILNPGSLDPSLAPGEFLYRLYFAFFGWIILFPAILCMLGKIKKFFLSDSSQHINSKTSQLNGWLLAILITPHPLLAFFSHNALERFYVFEALIIILVILILAFNLSSLKFLKILLYPSLVTALVLNLLQATWAAEATMQLSEFQFLKNSTKKIVGQGYHLPKVVNQLVVEIANELYGKIETLKIKKIDCFENRSAINHGIFNSLNLKFQENHFKSGLVCLWHRGNPLSSDSAQCTSTFGVFLLDDLQQATQNPSIGMKAAQNSWQNDQLRSWGYINTYVKRFCSDAANRCVDIAFGIRDCPDHLPPL